MTHLFKPRGCPCKPCAKPCAPCTPSIPTIGEPTPSTCGRPIVRCVGAPGAPGLPGLDEARFAAIVTASDTVFAVVQGIVLLPGIPDQRYIGNGLIFPATTPPTPAEITAAAALISAPRTLRSWGGLTISINSAASWTLAPYIFDPTTSTLVPLPNGGSYTFTAVPGTATVIPEQLVTAFVPAGSLLLWQATTPSVGSALSEVFNITARFT